MQVYQFVVIMPPSVLSLSLPTPDYRICITIIVITHSYVDTPAMSTGERIFFSTVLTPEANLTV